MKSLKSREINSTLLLSLTSLHHKERMAAIVENGSVVNKISPKKNVEECNGKPGNLLNGNVNLQNNGYTKSETISNGITKSAGGRAPQRGAASMEPMDWAQFDTDRGSFEHCSLLTAALTQLGLYILMFLGFVNQLLFTPKVATEKNREGYAPLYNPFEQFYSRYVYRRVAHCFNRPICSAPSVEISLMERDSADYNWSFRLTGRKLRCLNLGSYNYLGLSAEPESLPVVAAAVRRYGLALGSPRAELGSTALHQELEATTAAFLGVEAAIVFGMGFATNTLSLPGLLGAGTLALSDEKNHASLILGLRLARAAVRVFRHNDVRHLERVARKARAEGRWRRIIIVVEGVYSMEGSVAPLAAIVALKKRLGLQLYLDEAHSVGAMGARGRGVCELAGVDPRDVDVLMGTFTKSFGAAGGYVAGSERLVRGLRALGHAHSYAHAMAPGVAAQVLWALRALGGGLGAARVAALRDNTRHFRRRLRELGVVAYGHRESPVVPMLVYSFSKMAATVERLTARGIATVGVGFPATPLSEARIRFCLSAGHTREQLDRCLAAVDEVASELGLRYARAPAS
ncbi:serine palmitoyltransferase 3 [Ostrinia furnacalis]|uniref:serine palmitoyltransferase 3 n=1 Tax=Ostrinia furnacalis TaxID=93504 RepID=UPI00103E6749|nr:serine palmitoyltransferase 3 [Ostrinia furnacalis]